MSYPKVVALDTDWTLWVGSLDSTTWGKGPGASALPQDNIQREDRWVLRDKTNPKVFIRVFNEVSKVVNDILKNGAQLAIVTRNPNKAMSDRALYYFNTINPIDGKEWSIIDLVKYDEAVDESKVLHFRRIREWSGSDPSDMLLYDDEALNNSVKVELGATFQLAIHHTGLMWQTYQEGIDAWRRAKNITIPRSPGFVPRRVLIGYSGLSTFWINLVRKGEGFVDRFTPARWGYAFYVTDSAGIAKFYRDWDRHDFHRDSYVCEVWVKDYDRWASINKIWVPENNSKLPQMDNMHWSDELSGQNQESRDRIIASTWGVQTPYVLFCRHHAMNFPNLPPVRRMTEMVVYTQIQRSLFEVVQLADASVPNGDYVPVPFDNQMKSWNIKVPQETRQEFLAAGDTTLYQLSA